MSLHSTQDPHRSHFITVRELIEDDALGISLSVLAGSSGLDREIRSGQIQKSGLALVGHFQGTELSRIQLLGAAELSYLKKINRRRCVEAVRRFLELELCCLVIANSECEPEPPQNALDVLLAEAEATSTPLLLSDARSSRTVSSLHALLAERLAPRIRVHGVLVDVFEVGLLLLGSSGVGKSELALELVMRGHRLVADDVVECHYRPPDMIFGTPPELLRHHLEVRGLGILNVKDLFGVTSIRDRKRIDVVIKLIDSDDDTEIDRLGLDQRRHEILGVPIQELVIPVRPGRDMAAIMEVAARSELQRMAGEGIDIVSQIEDSLRKDRMEESAVPGSVRTRNKPETKPPPESIMGLPPSRKK